MATKRRAPAPSGDDATDATALLPARRPRSPSSPSSRPSPPRSFSRSPPRLWHGGERGRRSNPSNLAVVGEGTVHNTSHCLRPPLLFRGVVALLRILLVVAPLQHADAAAASWRRSSSSSSPLLRAVAPRGRPFLSSQLSRQSMCWTGGAVLSLGTLDDRRTSSRTLLSPVRDLRGGAVENENDADDDASEEEESEYDDEVSDGEEEGTAVEEEEEENDDEEEESDAEEGTTESSATTTSTRTKTKKSAAARRGAYDKPLVASPLLNLYASLAIMLLSKKVDLMSPVMVRIARFSFIAYLLFLQAFVFYVRIQAKISNDQTVITLQNPLSSMLQSQLAGGGGAGGGGGMVKSLASSFLSTSCTILEYDLKQASSLQSGLIMNMGFMWFLHFKMQQVQPLLIQSLTGLLNLMYHPLFQSYVLGRNLERPFVTPTPPHAQRTTPEDEDEEPSVTTEADESEPTLQAIEAANEDENESEEEEDEVAEAEDAVEEKEEEDGEDKEADDDVEVAGDDESDDENDQAVVAEHDIDGEGGSKEELENVDSAESHKEGEVTSTDRDANVKGDTTTEDPSASGHEESTEPESALASKTSVQEDGDNGTTDDP